MLDVGAFFVPGIQHTGCAGERVPLWCLCADLLIHLAERLPVNGDANHIGDFLARRPNIAQVNRLADVVVAEGFGGEVDVNPPRNRVCDDERW